MVAGVKWHEHELSVVPLLLRTHQVCQNRTFNHPHLLIPVHARKQAVNQIIIQIAVVAHLVHVIPLGLRHLLLHHLRRHLLHRHVSAEPGGGRLDAARQERHLVVQVADP